MRGVPAKIEAARSKAAEAAAAGANGGGATPEPDAAPAGASPEKYRKILDAAVQVIAENGYFNSPVSKIAARAGVADGTIYLYFKNKDDVLRAAIDRMMQRFYDGVEEEFKQVTDPRAQLEAIGRIHLETVTVDRNMAILMQTEVRQSAKFIAEFSQKHLARYIQTVREVVRRGQEQGVFRKELSAGVVAQCWFGAIDEMLTTAVFTGRDYDPKGTARQVLDVILNGIGA
jgi:TetR/AcrR family transcriptional regulator, fatty acid metabolism regulator protein